MAYASINPFTDETVAVFPYATDSEVDQAVAEAHTAFGAWRRTSFADRGALLLRAAELIAERSAELARLNTLEMGKLYIEALGEIEVIRQVFVHYAEQAERLLAPHNLNITDPNIGDAMVVYHPMGVVYAIEPWNVPFFQMARPLGAQLMAGNTVVLKHASNVPQCAAALEQLFLDAGLPQGVFTNLYLTHAQSERVIADKTDRRSHLDRQ